MKWNHGQASVSCTAPISWIGSSHGCHKPYFATHTFLFNVTPGDLELPGRKHNNPQNQPIQITNQNYINRIHNITNKKNTTQFFSPPLLVSSHLGRIFLWPPTPHCKKNPKMSTAGRHAWLHTRRQNGATAVHAQKQGGAGLLVPGRMVGPWLLWNSDTWKFLAKQSYL